MNLTYLRHYPYAKAHDGTSINLVRGLGASGDTVTLSFSVMSTSDVDEIVFEAVDLNIEAMNSNVETTDSHIKTTNLNSEEMDPNKKVHKIAAGNIEIYIAKVWEQAGLGRKQGKRIQVRELLLKDDRQPLMDRYRRGYKHWRQFSKAAMFYCPPDVRLDGPASTRLDAGVAKQIWITVRVPNLTPPGIYRGMLAVRSSRTSCEQRMSIEIEILDICLSKPKQDLMMFYKGTLDVKRPQFFVTTKTLRHQLQDIFDHGFRSITIDEQHPKLAQKVIDICEEIGFDGHLVLMNFDHLDKLNFNKMLPCVYVSDELDLQSQHEANAIGWHKRNYEFAEKYKVKSMASLFSAGFAERYFDDTDIACAPDVILYNLSTNRKFFETQAPLASGRESRYYYWNSHMEKPDLHRVLAGVYLWKSKAAGIAPYCYQHLPQYPFSPYDDFDEWEPGCNKSTPYIPLRDHCTTYPAKNGSIPTVQWEGMREGIIDLKYLTTLYETIDQARQTGQSTNQKTRRLADEIEKRVATFLEKISLSQVIVNSETSAEPYAHLNSEELQLFREEMARDIVSLKRVLNTDLIALTANVVEIAYD